MQAILFRMDTKKESQKTKKEEKTIKKDDSSRAKKALVKVKPSKGAADSTPPPVDAKPRPSLAEKDVNKVFMKEALTVARHLNVDRLLFICNDPKYLDELTARSIKKKVIVASSSDKQAVQAEHLGLMHELIPDYAFDRFEKIKVALASCTASGKTTDKMLILCLVGEHNSPLVDTCMVTRVGKHSNEQAALSGLLSDTDQSMQVLEAVLNIALSVGFEGNEGDPVGTIFVVGDSTAVMEKSRQLTLNPFQGYSEEERNILDPSIRNAVKNFCLLDGAIIVREDGVILAAGRYLNPPDDLELDLPMGLGTRHASAMAITAATKAISFVISKTTGTVRIYKEGKLAVELRQPGRRP